MSDLSTLKFAKFQLTKSQATKVKGGNDGDKPDDIIIEDEVFN